MNIARAQQPVSYVLCTEVGNFTHVVEASTLGLAPGEWPGFLQPAADFGNGQPLVMSSSEYRDGELVAVNYKQLLGVLIVRVFND